MTSRDWYAVPVRDKASGNEFLTAVRNTDLLAQIVRAFENEAILHAEDSIDIMRDISTIDTELLFADLQMIENPSFANQPAVQKRRWRIL